MKRLITLHSLVKNDHLVHCFQLSSNFLNPSWLLVSVCLWSFILVMKIFLESWILGKYLNFEDEIGIIKGSLAWPQWNSFKNKCQLRLDFCSFFFSITYLFNLASQSLFSKLHHCTDVTQKSFKNRLSKFLWQVLTKCFWRFRNFQTQRGNSTDELMLMIRQIILNLICHSVTTFLDHKQKYSRLRCLLLVKGLVIGFYLGWSGSTLLITKHIIKVGSKS